MTNATIAAEIMTTVELPRFGTFTYAESDVIVFPWGLPGFPDSRRFLALSLEVQPHVTWLQCLDDTKLALPAADPWQFFPDYQPRLTPAITALLEIDRPDDFVVLNVLIIPPQGDVTMNLLAPIVINLQKSIGRQVVLEGSDYAVRTPLPPAEAGKSVTR